MRVDRLHLDNFKNLVDFEVDFDVSSSRQVVVGRNGVGKSNLLEAMAQIFRDLDLEEDSNFGYEIEYHCNGHFVKIKSEKKEVGSPGAEIKFNRSYFIVAEDSEPKESNAEKTYTSITQANFYKRNRPINNEVNPERILPLYVFGYYSGTSGRFNEVFSKHEERYYREQVTGKEAPLRSLFLSKPHHSQFALLSFFASHDEPAQKFLQKELRVEGLDSVLFALHEPYWKRPPKKQKSKEKTDDRFWQAGGKVAPFLSALYEHSFAPMAGSTREKVSIAQEKTFERRFCFIKNESTLRSMAGDLDPKEFFARLESTIFSDLISKDGKDVKINIRLVGAKEPVTFKELSEGEQQLLTIIGLMRFTAQNESLFLLDEPDTNLNPAWCLDYLENLRKYGVEPENSQIIMTTHSPLTFAGLDKNEVVIMERGRDQKIYSEHPVNAPKGMGFQAILTSDFFGLRSALDKETLAKLDEKRVLALKEKKTDEDRRRLAELDNELGRLDFSKSARDPLYLEYIRAMTNAQVDNPEIARPAPQKEQWRIRKDIAKQIAENLSKRVSDKCDT